MPTEAQNRGRDLIFAGGGADWANTPRYLAHPEIAVIRRIQTSLGNTGYRDQLDRARRFLDRVQAPIDEIENPSEVEFQDDMWSFFQNCWHVKDWVMHDPLASSTQKDEVSKAAHASTLLMICRDMCNGTKHLGVREGAGHRYVEMTRIPGGPCFEMDCFLDDGAGNLVSGKQLARECIAEWERILSAQGLAIARRS
jgi:hypothetical protein